MQLISILLLLLSLAVLFGAILFVRLWHSAHRKCSATTPLREHIEHIGISAVVVYPHTTAPLSVLLEERYPHCEVIVVVDLQQQKVPFDNLISRYHLVKVNHTHLDGVRKLYRSRHRAFRRVVVVDLPLDYHQLAETIAREVASYGYSLLLYGESIVTPETLAYCATAIASHHTSEHIALSSLVGADVRLEPSDSDNLATTELFTDRVLATTKRGQFISFAVLLMPSVLVVLSHLIGSKVLLGVAVTTLLIGALLLYLSCRVMSNKGVFVSLDTISYNFYRFVIEKVKNYHYLYKESRVRVSRIVQPIVTFVQRTENNQKRL